MKTFFIYLFLLFPSGCSQPLVSVLPAYTLADGSIYQDVVSVASDGKGTSPTVVSLRSFRLTSGQHSEMISQVSGVEAGIVNSLSASVGGVVTSSAPFLLALKRNPSNKISNITNSNINNNGSNNTNNKNNNGSFL